MGREVRRVPANWEHPKDSRGNFQPLYDNYQTALQEFQKHVDERGLRDALEYWGGGPVSYKYMLPDVSDDERTHYMMYEDTSEGTPISPAFATPEELAQWLADNDASFFGDMAAPYETWLHICKGGYVPVLLASEP